MSENTPIDSAAPQAPHGVDAAAQAQLASARRRRFIKMGAGAVPVALTLASRPVMATNCISASAWGSVQGLAGSSQFIRAQGKAISQTGYCTLASWQTTACAGWGKLGLTATTCKTYKLSTLLAASGLSTTAGILNPSNVVNVWDVLTTTSPVAYTSYQKTMVAAWLNYATLPNAKLCVTDTTNVAVNRLKDLGNIPAGGSTLFGKPWTQAGVVTYLTSNYLA